MRSGWFLLLGRGVRLISSQPINPLHRNPAWHHYDEALTKCRKGRPHAPWLLNSVEKKLVRLVKTPSLSREEKRMMVKEALDRIDFLKPAGRRERLYVLSGIRDFKATISTPELYDLFVKKSITAIPSESEARELAEMEGCGEETKCSELGQALLYLISALTRLPSPLNSEANRALALNFEHIWSHQLEIPPTELIRALHCILPFCLRPPRDLPASFSPSALHARVANYYKVGKKMLSQQNELYLLFWLGTLRSAQGEQSRREMKKELKPLASSVNDLLIQILDSSEKDRSSDLITVLKSGSSNPIDYSPELVEQVTARLKLTLLAPSWRMNSRAMARLVKLANFLNIRLFKTLPSRLCKELHSRMDEKTDDGNFVTRLKDLLYFQTWFRSCLFDIGKEEPMLLDGLLVRCLNPLDIYAQDFPAQALSILSALAQDNWSAFHAALKRTKLEANFHRFLTDSFYNKDPKSLEQSTRLDLYTLDCIVGFFQSSLEETPRMSDSFAANLGLDRFTDIARASKDGGQKYSQEPAKRQDIMDHEKKMAKGGWRRERLVTPFPYSLKAHLFYSRSKKKEPVQMLERGKVVRDLGSYRAPSGNRHKLLYGVEEWEMDSERRPGPAASQEMALLERMGYRVEPFPLLNPNRRPSSNLSAPIPSSSSPLEEEERPISVADLP